MSAPHIEWERKHVVKYSTIARMKNGLRKTYFYETDCRHQAKTLQELACPLCDALFECCQKCYNDFSESDVNAESYDDLICPDCIEQCHKCKKYVAEENGSRNDVYPYELYCVSCAENLGFCYDSPDEFSKDKDSTPQIKNIVSSESEESESEYSDDSSDNE